MKLEKIIVYAFFAALLVLGGSIYTHYGLSYDELSAHDLGYLNYHYITEGNPTIFRYSDKDYAPAFEIFAIAVEKLVGLENGPTDQMFFLRHYLIFLSFYVGVFFLYLLIKENFSSLPFLSGRMLGLAGAILLVLSPRIFGHAFFNSKDIPFMAFMIVSAYSGLRFIQNPSWWSAFFHGLASALAIDMRIGGVLMPLVTCVMYGLKILYFPQQRPWKQLGLIFFYLVCTGFFVVLMWPMLWQNPIENFMAFFKSASHFRYPHLIFYMGQWLSPADHELPWHYLPLWITVSIPLGVLLLFLTGLMHGLYAVCSNFKESLQKPIALFALLWFFIPLAGVLVLKPTIYDGWRHFYFLYPAILILALYALCTLASSRNFFIGVTIFLGINMGFVAASMMRMHPYEHVYFNRLAGKDFKEALGRFQLDIWGVEFRKSLEYILQHDSRPHIQVYASNVFTPLSLFLIPPKDKDRIKFVKNPQEADYYILDHLFLRTHPGQLWGAKKFFVLSLDGVDIIHVYRSVQLRPWPNG